MRRAFRVALVAAMLFAVASIAAFQGEADSTTLTGRFVWENGNNTGDLEAVFTPTGDGEWNVSFHFKFRGKRHVYSGSARGSLSAGKLEGRVLNENGSRTFTFEGTFKDGQFSGKHAEIRGDRAASTGTLTLD